MSPEVEKIGLAKQAEEVQRSSADSGAAATPATSEPPRRPQTLLLIVLLVASLGMAIALANQVQRAGQLESQVTTLGVELDRARGDLAAYEQRMQGVRGAVADLTTRMTALQKLVDAPTDSSSRP